MPDIVMSAHMGIDNAHDDLRMPEGYFRIIQGAYLKPDDPDRLWKAPGRTLAGTFLAATSVSGLEFMQQDQGDSFALWANGKVYTAPAGMTGVDTWTPAQDRSDPTPLDFAQVGNTPKAIHDGTGRWILWSGDAAEIPLLREVDGTFRKIGIDKPGPILSATLVTVQGTDFFPDTVTAVPTFDEWDDPANSYDDDLNTSASKSYTVAGNQVAGVWGFADTDAVASGSGIQVTVATSSLPPTGVDNPGDAAGGIGGGGVGGLDPIEAWMAIEISEDSGGTWTEVWRQYSPISLQRVSISLPNAATWDLVQVRITGSYDSGQGALTFRVYEISGADGSADEVDPGSYDYCLTECYKDPGNREIESAPSDKFTVVVPDSPPTYGIILTLSPGPTNTAANGYDETRIQRRVYRSTKTGVFPDCGFIAYIGASETSFLDKFDVTGETLGSPVIPTIAAVGDLSISLCETVPAIRDAALYRGSVVIVPAAFNATLMWSVPGAPDWFPIYTHRLDSMPSERNDTLKAVCAINDSLLLFFRTRVLRIQDLPMVSDQTFDIRIADQDILSPSEGLAGGIHSYCSFNAETGRALVAWVSDSGIWMTDGSLNFERGLGCVKLSTRLDWPNTVDTARLEETSLTFDPVEQIMWFLYWNPAGYRQALAFHLSKLHWSEDAPKVTGPHDYPLRNHLVGEFTTALRLWSWEALYDSNLALYNIRLYNERTGIVDEARWYDPAGQIETYLESGWLYPQGSLGEWQIYRGALFHSNWGPNHMADIRLEFRQDARGIVQSLRKGISLLGSRISSFWLSRSGRSLRVTLRHLGHAEGALGPFVFEGESLGPAEGA